MKKIFGILLALVLCAAVCCGTAETATVADWFGTIDGSVYENPMVGLGCDLDGWRYFTQDEILESSKMTEEILHEDLAELVKEATSVIVMQAEKNDGLQTVNIAVQEFSAYMATVEAVGMETVLEIVKEQVILPAFRIQPGFSDVTAEIVQREIGGTAFYAIRAKGTYYGFSFFQEQIAFLRGDYLAYLTISTFTEDAVDEAVSHFYLLDE